MTAERERRAWVCNNSKCDKPPRRIFLVPGETLTRPVCGDCGRPLDRQKNEAYLLKDTLAEAKAVLKRHQKEEK